MREPLPTRGCCAMGGGEINFQKIIVLYSPNQLKIPRRNMEYSHFKPTGISPHQGPLMSAGVTVYTTPVFLKLCETAAR